MTRRRAIAAVVASWLSLLPVDAAAHERSTSYAAWQLDDTGGTVSLKLRERDRDVLRASAGTSGVIEHLPDWIVLRTGETPCAPRTPVRELGAAPGWARYEWSASCAPPGPSAKPAAAGSTTPLDEARPKTIDARGLLARIPGHLHLARIAWSDRRPAAQRSSESASPNSRLAGRVALTASSPSIDLGRPGAAPAGIIDYVALGFEHIARGADHLLFVFVLLVALTRARDAALAVTGFTVGHSVTLALVALDVTAARPAPVEALVALSIALVAIENLWLSGGRRDSLVAVAGPALCLTIIPFGTPVPPIALAGLALFCACELGLLSESHSPERVRAGISVLFGLLHGLAFAGGLRELTGSVRVAELFGFNVGVELGQLCAVAVAWPLLASVRRRIGVRRVANLGSATALAAGVAWFVTRVS